VRSNLLWAAIVAAVMLPFAQTKADDPAACAGTGCARPHVLVSSASASLEVAPPRALPGPRAKD
jgi:hypothetical protein